MNKYKIVCCNLGYDTGLSKIDKKIGTFEECIKKIKRFGTKRSIDGFEIVRFNTKEVFDMFDDIITIIETQDEERSIYLRKI